MKNLFVYGTLKAGFCRHIHLATARFVGNGTIRGVLYDFGEYPGAWLSDHGEIKGELYELESDDFTTLDQIEGFDSQHPGEGLFYRTLTKVQIAGARLADAWVYVLHAAPIKTPVIVDGNYQG
jgi:gamma-glutamylcyclotransferase (GGCT)/AIG2-like uncharacterized protein YtfP